MHRTIALRALTAVGAAAALVAAVLAGPAESAGAAAPRAADLLAGLAVADRGSGTGASSGFAYWRAADGSCRTPPVQVLSARSSRKVAPGGCTVKTGRWTSAFTGARLTSTTKATVQWTVPLPIAWQSGAAGWSALRRQAYANDVGYTGSLLVVDASSAKRRGGKDLSAWMPVSKQRCAYTKDWIAVKARWSLTVTTKERSALAAALKRYCRTSPTVSAPGIPDVVALTGTAEPALPSATPAPTSTPSAAPTAAPAPTATPTTAPGPTPTAAPTATASPAPTPSPTSTPNPTPSPACSATGTAGIDLPPVIASTPSSAAVVLGAGVYDFTDFTASPWGVDLPTRVTGISGSAAGGTTIQLRTCTSTHAADVPTASGTTNQLSLLRVSGSPTLQDLTLQATQQGHLYNGLRMNQTLRGTVRRVAVRGVPGNSDTPPGETFGINDFKGVDDVYDHVLVDGMGVGGAGLGFNSSSNATVTDSAFTRNRWSAGITVWQTNGVAATGTTLSSNKLGLNLERAGGEVRLTDCTFSGDATDVRIASDRTPTASLVIVDPVITASDGRLRISLPATYRGVANTQTKADVTVIEDGQDVTARVVTWTP